MTDAPGSNSAVVSITDPMVVPGPDSMVVTVTDPTGEPPERRTRRYRPVPPPWITWRHYLLTSTWRNCAKFFAHSPRLLLHLLTVRTWTMRTQRCSSANARTFSGDTRSRPTTTCASPRRACRRKPRSGGMLTSLVYQMEQVLGTIQQPI